MTEEALMAMHMRKKDTSRHFKWAHNTSVTCVQCGSTLQQRWTPVREKNRDPYGRAARWRFRVSALVLHCRDSAHP